MDYKTKIANLLALPKEITLNLPLVILTGRQELDIENYKGILEYTETKIRINTRAGLLVAEGDKLRLTQLTAENLRLRGNIERVYYAP
jgi:sporulation protein YqfC